MTAYQSEPEPKKSLRSSGVNQLINLFFKTGAFRLGREFASKSLTVINYHRINDLSQPGFDSFKPNVSADNAAFTQQLDYVMRWFKVVSTQDVVGWLNGQGSLPPYAALITFDDGYLDNYTNAFPVLRQRSLPAVIFLTTGHIDSDAPFYWDLAAYCFSHTSLDHVQFPDGSVQSWSTAAEKDQICKGWIEALKVLSDEVKQTWVDQLPEKMGVSIPANTFRSLMMNWDQVREMQKNGIEFGGHTIHHPILSRISLEQAGLEISGSKERIEKELGLPPLSFAYPNGMSGDLNLKIEALVAQAGYKVAFTLQNGPSPLKEVRENPYAIRRIFISHRHNLPRFAMQLSWFNRLRG